MKRLILHIPWYVKIARHSSSLACLWCRQAWPPVAFVQVTPLRDDSTLAPAVGLWHPCSIGEERPFSLVSSIVSKRQLSTCVCVCVCVCVCERERERDTREKMVQKWFLCNSRIWRFPRKRAQILEIKWCFEIKFIPLAKVQTTPGRRRKWFVFWKKTWFCTKLNFQKNFNLWQN